MSATAARSPAATEVDQWLTRFGEALEQGDAAGAAELFAPESYWRDLVAFTWNIKTVEGRAGITDMLEHTLAPRQAARLAHRPRSRPPPTASPTRGSGSIPPWAVARGIFG